MGNEREVWEMKGGFGNEVRGEGEQMRGREREKEVKEEEWAKRERGKKGEKK